ncbi:MAG: hypothetical protein ABIG66_00545 [Candidatus Kerfeldbacteria bacterium]
MYKKITKTLSAAGASLFGTMAVGVHAALAQTEYFDPNDTIGTSSGLPTRSAADTALAIANVFLGTVAIIAVILIIYGGFTWMTSGGSEEKVTKGKNILIWAVIGLLIIMSAWGITLYLIGILVPAT